MDGTLYLEHSEAHQPRTWRWGTATDGRTGPRRDPPSLLLACRCGRVVRVSRERVVRGRVVGLHCPAAEGGCGFHGEALLEGMENHEP